MKTKHGADRLAEKLTKQNHHALAIHGDLRQRKRDAVIQDFRNLKKRIMVATDIAARGLDIPHIKHVSTMTFRNALKIIFIALSNRPSWHGR